MLFLLSIRGKRRPSYYGWWAWLQYHAKLWSRLVNSQYGCIYKRVAGASMGLWRINHVKPIWSFSWHDQLTLLWENDEYGIPQVQQSIQQIIPWDSIREDDKLWTALCCHYVDTNLSSIPSKCTYITSSYMKSYVVHCGIVWNSVTLYAVQWGIK